jgi:oxygen-independent coproporphyrinogen-3 oxidase
MAGLYFHIPFCHQACHYCDFHFSTVTRDTDNMVRAMLNELELRNAYFNDEGISTIYFGGGTPSLLSAEQLRQLLEFSARLFKVEQDAEVTLETNPEDITEENLLQWKTMGINRLSIGIQSFRDEDLQYMNRNHSARQSLEVVQLARQFSFDNLTIDLIYGTPTMNDEDWEFNLDVLRSLDLPHFSAYSLTVEPRTALAKLVQSRTYLAPEEDQSARQFFRLMEWAKEFGYEHYEISNFAKPGRYSRHNTAYWNGVNYLGIGPSAHSFNGAIRHWNIRNNQEYIRSVLNDKLPEEQEELSVRERYNEYVLTSLRTQWGMDTAKVKALFGETIYHKCLEALRQLEHPEWMEESEGKIVLSMRGKLFADHIASMLFAESK